MTKQRFKVGDTVRLNQDYMQYKAGKQGTVFKVERADTDQLVRVDGIDFFVYDYRLDLVEDTKPMPKFKVGDKVEQSEPTTYSFIGKPFTVGTVTKVGFTKDSCSYDYRVDFSAASPTYRNWGMMEEELELVEAAKPVFKVGDRVRVVDSKNYSLVYVGYEGTVEGTYDRFVILKSIPFSYPIGMFELVSEAKEDPTVADVASDPVNNPSHYTNGSIECIDYIKSVLTKEQFIGWLRGNLIKYQHRYPDKGKPVEDLQKIEFYLKRLIQEESQT